MRFCDIDLPNRIVWFGLDERAKNRDTLMVRLECPGGVARCDLRLSDLDVAHSKIAWPPCVALIGVHQPISDGQCLTEGVERCGKVALSLLHIAQQLVVHGEFGPDRIRVHASLRYLR